MPRHVEGTSMTLPTSRGRWLALGLALALHPLARAGDDAPIELDGLDAYRGQTGAWAVVGGVHLDPENPRRLAADPGTGVIYNGPAGRTTNLVTRQAFGDVEASIEFLVPKGSNSGVKFAGRYELQIFDSHGKKTIDGGDNGGIYPRAELLPFYHHLDAGTPPRVNASRAPGEWQTLEVSFRAPRFDAGGKKTANARFVKVLLNGQVIHEDVEVASPTGHAWHTKETPTGPLFLQADHGPVAFRKIRLRPSEAKRD